MRITGIDFCGVAVTPRTNWCFLLVRTEDGRTGLGECTLAKQEALLAAEAARLASRVVGCDALARNRLARLLPHAQGGLVAQTVLSAFEGALWDLAGQALGRPIHALLGGALRETVPLYANINRGTNPRTPEGFAAAAGRALAAGFRAIKLAPFDPIIWEDAAEPGWRQGYAEGLARIAAVRAAIGPDKLLVLRLSQDGVDDFVGAWPGTEYALAIGAALKGSAYDALHWSSFNYLDNRQTDDATPMSTVLRQASGLPVITNGGIAEGVQAEAALTTGAADMVAIGRPIFAHPDWAYIVRSGAPYDWAAFDRKYVIRPPLDYAIAYPLALTDPKWPTL
jgi:hypothetical protein